MSEKRRFLVNLFFDPEYRGCVADIPERSGCMSQGKTVEAALKNVRRAIQVYMKANALGSENANLTNGLYSAS
jgi:predicted RNase H-like HicB family nuclease